MKAVARRVAQLEKRVLVLAIDPVKNPRNRVRILVTNDGALPGPCEATCTRTLCGDGTLLEVVDLGDNQDPTDEELDRIVSRFPVKISGSGEFAR